MGTGECFIMRNSIVCTVHLIVRVIKSRRAFKILAGKPTGKRPLGRPRRIWKDNIRMDLKEICVNTRNCNDLVQDIGEAFENEALN